MADFAEENEKWKIDFTNVPTGKRIFVSNYIWDKWATFDPTWGNGRGAWFDEKNQIVSGVKRWHPDGVAYQNALWGR